MSKLNTITRENYKKQLEKVSKQILAVQNSIKNNTNLIYESDCEVYEKFFKDFEGKETIKIKFYMIPRGHKTYNEKPCGGAYCIERYSFEEGGKIFYHEELHDLPENVFSHILLHEIGHIIVPSGFGKIEFAHSFLDVCCNLTKKEWEQNIIDFVKSFEANIKIADWLFDLEEKGSWSFSRTRMTVYAEIAADLFAALNNNYDCTWFTVIANDPKSFISSMDNSLLDFKEYSMSPIAKAAAGRISLFFIKHYYNHFKKAIARSGFKPVSLTYYRN